MLKALFNIQGSWLHKGIWPKNLTIINKELKQDINDNADTELFFASFRSKYKLKSGESIFVVWEVVVPLRIQVIPGSVLGDYS